MKFPHIISSIGFVLFTLSTAASAEEWIPIDDGDELRQLFSGKSLDGSDFADYYRSDGAMAYINKQYGTVVVRKWVVSDDGELCTYIFVMPEKLVECTRFERSGSDPDLYRMTIVRQPKANPDDAYKVQGKLTATPEQKLIEALDDVAGPAN